MKLKPLLLTEIPHVLQGINLISKDLNYDTSN